MSDGRDNRYQHQPLVVRLWRRLAWMPYRYGLFLLWVARWLARGARMPQDDHLDFCPNRRALIKLYWTLSRSMSHTKMRWYYTTEEVFGNK